MAITIEKIKDLVFDEILTLGVISKDEDLTNILTETTNLTLPIIINLAKTNKLAPQTKTNILDLFNTVILTKDNLIKDYLRLAFENNKVVEMVKAEENTETPTPILEKKITNKKELPRRYGKEHINNDIKKQGGKATTAQLTGLAVNDLKNLWVNLSARMIKEMLGDERKLSDEEYRVIRSTITILENKIKPILNKK